MLASGRGFTCRLGIVLGSSTVSGKIDPSPLAAGAQVKQTMNSSRETQGYVHFYQDWWCERSELVIWSPQFYLKFCILEPRQTMRCTMGRRTVGVPGEREGESAWNGSSSESRVFPQSYQTPVVDRVNSKISMHFPTNASVLFHIYSPQRRIVETVKFHSFLL